MKNKQIYKSILMLLALFLAVSNVSADPLSQSETPTLVPVAMCTYQWSVPPAGCHYGGGDPVTNCGQHLICDMPKPVLNCDYKLPPKGCYYGKNESKTECNAPLICKAVNSDPYRVPTSTPIKNPSTLPKNELISYIKKQIEILSNLLKIALRLEVEGKSSN